MNPAEVKKAVFLLGQLFPSQLTEELARFARDEFKGFEAADVEKAMRTHRATREFINWPQLLEGCRVVAGARTKAEGNASREGTWCDVYRRQRPDLVGRPDLEVVLRIHRGWWAKAGGFETDESKRKPSDSYRRQIEHSCITQLVASGTNPDDAPKWAATIFEESVDYFRQVLDEVREAATAPEQQAIPV